MSYRVALNFEDGVTRVIQVNPMETVMDAAYRQKVNLPVDCSDGVCGTCKCHCEQGAFDLGDEYLEEALSEDEAEVILKNLSQNVKTGRLMRLKSKRLMVSNYYNDTQQPHTLQTLRGQSGDAVCGIYACSD